MLSINNFRHQIVFSVSITVVLLWISGVLFFKSYIDSDFEKDRQLKLNVDQNTVNLHFGRMIDDSIKISKNISKEVIEVSKQNAKIYDEIKRLVSGKIMYFNDIRFAYYDKEMNYKSISEIENIFSIQDKLPAKVLEKYQNLLEGGTFVHCSEACRLYHLKPAFNVRFDKGMIQVSFSLSSILDELIKKLPDSNIIILKKTNATEGIKINNVSYEFHLTSNMHIYEKLKKHLPKNNELYKIIEGDDYQISLNYLNVKYFDNIIILTARDTSKNKEIISDLYLKYFIISVFIMVFIILSFVFFLKIPIRRLNSLSAMLAIIGEGKFKYAGEVLNKTKREKAYDELDMIHNVTHQLANQLESMHQSLMDSNKKLINKVSEATYLADHDVLTGLYNRRRFNQELHDTANQGTNFSLASIDMNHFKLVNDSLGHQSGDQLLISFSNTLLDVLGDIAIIGRMGGDEFSVVLPECDREKTTDIFSELVVKASQISLGESMIFKVSFSIGVALYPEDSNDLEELTAFSDAAMYENKRFKNSDFNFYTGCETLLKEEQDSQYWNRITKEAINDRTIKLVFQSIVSSINHKVHAYEVLSRIKHEGTLVSPSVYMHYLERNRMIIQYDRTVLDMALSTGSQQLGYPQLMINLSYLTLSSPDMTNYILERSQYFNYPAHKIVFEITERIEINDLSIACGFMEKLKKSGFSFALDDFGEGFSSFAYLTELPINYLKIDKKITSGLLTNPTDHSIIRSILLLTKSLNIKVIAEGIEKIEISEAISKYDVCYLQGYYFSWPLSPEELRFKNKVSQSGKYTHAT